MTGRYPLRQRAATAESQIRVITDCDRRQEILTNALHMAAWKVCLL